MSCFGFHRDKLCILWYFLSYLFVGSHDRVSLIQPDHLRHLREQIEPMGNQQYHRIRRVSPQIFENPPLRIPIKGGKRVVQYQQRLFMTEGPGQRQSLGLAAGKPHTAISHQGLYAIWHPADFFIQADQTQVFLGVARITHPDILLDGIVEKLRIMSKIPDIPEPGSFVHFRKIFLSQMDAALIRIFT